MDITRVPQSHECVRGILNLRGQIVTIIDLGQRLGLASTDLDKESRNIIVNSKGEYIGLNVDKLSDVVQAQWDTVEPPPANIGGVQGKFFLGVYKTEKELIGILDIDEVLREEEF
jgi:purine-binding chemotaxis protein CheW